MAITTYAELQSAIADWLARDDLTARIPDFITLFEAAACRKLRVRPMETSTSLTPSAGSVALPTGYLGWRRVTWTGSTRRELEYVHPSMLQAMFPDNAAGSPSHFTIEGANLKIRPTDNTALEFDYYAKTAAVSGSLNWLFTNHPDAYLAGALVEAHLFAKDPDSAAIWLPRRDAAFSEIHLVNFNEQGSMAISVMGPTP